MLFHTWTFALLMLLFYPVYLAVKGTRARLPLMLLASYVFYGWWDVRYLVLIVYATAVDYTVVLLMDRAKRRWLRKALLAAAVANSLALLGQFKYAAFAVDSVNSLAGWLGLAWRMSPAQVVWPLGVQVGVGWLNDLTSLAGMASPGPMSLLLPVGISFYVFQSMSYTIDFYRGQVDKEPNFIRFATFVSLFPQLVAGPIERASNLLPQLRAEPKVSLGDVTDGMSMFVVGLFKKLALADYLALYVDKVYDAPSLHGSPALILATFAFGWQIYFDFSGYTDMARGVARMMGLRLMLNFNNPYLASSLGEFWSRWHISLSTWFRDYVYVPLGGNRRGAAATYRNMLLTMVVSGLWHGAAWTFVAWGLLHALGRFATRRLEASDFYEHRVPKPLKQALVFAFVTFAWIFFRAQSFSDAWQVVTGVFTGPWSDPGFPLLAAGLIGAVWAYQYLHESRFSWLLRLSAVRVGLVVLMILYLALVPGQGRPFIYFQF